jgi:hypothetical protein
MDCVEVLRRLLQLEWEVNVCHTYSEENQCVALVHIRCELGSSVIFYESCLTQITHIFLDDTSSRLITSKHLTNSSNYNSIRLLLDIVLDFRVLCFSFFFYKCFSFVLVVINYLINYNIFQSEKIHLKS